MTQEEQIKQLKPIVEAVLAAEKKVRKRLLGVIAEAKFSPDGDKLTDKILADAIVSEMLPLKLLKENVANMQEFADLYMRTPMAVDEPSTWISVDERLPEHGEHVLLSFGKHNINAVGFFDRYSNTWFAYEYNIVDANYWMPIPKLPKGGAGCQDD